MQKINRRNHKNQVSNRSDYNFQKLKIDARMTNPKMKKFKTASPIMRLESKYTWKDSRREYRCFSTVGIILNLVNYIAIKQN